MNLEKLYKMQEELDNHIWEKHETLDKMSKEELLDSTILALLVEMGELANTTRCFKHWSTKGMMEKEIVLDELADVLHFYLSIGNQVKITIDYNVAFLGQGLGMNHVFLEIYHSIIAIDKEDKNNDWKNEYHSLGHKIISLGNILGFTNEEVEQAYLKKHEENYRRQKEGY